MPINRYWKEPGFNQEQYLAQPSMPSQGGMAVMPNRKTLQQGPLSQMQSSAMQQMPMQAQPQSSGQSVASILAKMYPGIDLQSQGIGSTVYRGNQGYGGKRRNMPMLMQQGLLGPQFDDSVFGQGLFK